MFCKNDVNRVSFRIGPSYRDLFKSICHGICSIATVAEYNEKRKWLHEIANIFPDISQWQMPGSVTFPAFRYFSYLSVTLAENGNSVLKCCMQLWFLEAAWDDTSTMVTQIHKFKSFLTQVTSSSGKGPCFLTCDRANRAIHIHAAKAYVAEFSNKHAHSKAIEENTNPQVFMPLLVSGTGL